jgi:hypothetical protein
MRRAAAALLMIALVLIVLVPIVLGGAETLAQEARTDETARADAAIKSAFPTALNRC